MTVNPQHPLKTSVGEEKEKPLQPKCTVLKTYISKLKFRKKTGRELLAAFHASPAAISLSYIC